MNTRLSHTQNKSKNDYKTSFPQDNERKKDGVLLYNKKAARCVFNKNLITSTEIPILSNILLLNSSFVHKMIIHKYVGLPVDTRGKS